MVRWPGRIKPRVSDFPNVTLDVLPTLCEFAGVAPPADRALDGMSLKSHLLQGARPKRKVPMYWHFEKQARLWAAVGEGYDRRQDGERPVNDPVPHVVIRRDDYALRGYKTGQRYAPPERHELHDVVRDPLEKRELSTHEPAFSFGAREK